MKTFISTMTVAAVATMAFGSLASAQTMIGNQQISAQDMAKVTEYCASLSATTGKQTATVTKGTQSGSGSGTKDLAATDSSNAMSNGKANSGTDVATGDGMIRLNDITAADCKAAGLKTVD